MKIHNTSKLSKAFRQINQEEKNRFYNGERNSMRDEWKQEPYNKKGSDSTVLQQASSIESRYNKKKDSDLVGRHSNESMFQVFKSLNSKVYITEENLRKDIGVNTSNPYHEHNNYSATLVLRCKDCDSQVIKVFDI